MLPTFLGLGAARAGSTWIARNLMEHPDVYLPRKKELHFFDRHYAKGLPYYEAEFASWGGEKAVGEVTPDYFHDENVAPLIRAHFPAIKLFVCLRNPVDRAYSHYWRLVAVASVERQTPFEDVLAAPNDVLQAGCYFDHLRRYYQLFSREQVLVLFFEDLHAAPEALLSRLFEFLEVDSRVGLPMARQKINAAASLQDLGKSRLLWYAARALTRAGMFGSAGKLQRLNSTVLPPMKPETRAYLATYYRGQIDKLADLTGRDLSHWVAEDVVSTM